VATWRDYARATLAAVMSMMPLVLTALSLLAFGVVTAAAGWDLIRGDYKCGVAGADSVWGDASWSWLHLGTTCDYSALPVGEGTPSSPGRWRLVVALVAVAGIAVALYRASSQDRWRLGMAVSVTGLCSGSLLIAFSGIGM
jgi:hypothetical protein